MKKLTTTILTCGICLGGLYRAGAAAQLRLSDGTPGGTIVIVDDGPNDQFNTTPGVVVYTGPVGANWIVNVTVGTSKPAEGGPASPVMDVGTQNISAGAGTLTVDWSDTDFTAGGLAELSIGGTTVGSVTYEVFTDPANTNFGMANLVGTVGPSSSGAFNGDVFGNVPLNAPYSMTLEAVIQHPSGGTSGFDAVVTVTPPACNCTLTFNAPSSITNCAGDPIPDVTASQNCGSGSTAVPVTVVGAVTSGICPQVITRTNSAVDSCGTAYTFIQNITINCAPDCTITPSVTTTIVGTTGLTASVADAGVGATYEWNILNGSITLGQGTRTITWTAGADTNSPVTIVVKVTTAAGCQSTCSACVRLTKPPQISLGGGDTATIGFWHNKNGQGLILGAPNAPALANWLASNFPCLYGSLAGKSNKTVADLFLADFGVKGQKTYAQVLAGAFACYFTSSNLGGNAASAKFGFNITPGGTGSKSFNVGSLGTTIIGLQNNTSYTILQILQAANSKCPFSPAVFDALNTIFDGINTTGDIN